MNFVSLRSYVSFAREQCSIFKSNYTFSHQTGKTDLEYSQRLLTSDYKFYESVLALKNMIRSLRPAMFKQIVGSSSLLSNDCYCYVDIATKMVSDSLVEYKLVVGDGLKFTEYRRPGVFNYSLLHDPYVEIMD